MRSLLSAEEGKPYSLLPQVFRYKSKDICIEDTANVYFMFVIFN